MRNGFPFSNLLTSLWHSLSGRDEPGTTAAAPCGADLVPPLAGPLVNVDGIPMLDNVVDVMGKVYGDDGSSHTHDHGMFDAGGFGSGWE